MEVSFKPAEKFPTKCLKLNGILYVPHYTENGYAYPGIKKFAPSIPEYDLMRAGAVEVVEYLYGSLGRDSK